MTGQQVSHFRIGDKLGAGGMGVVYEAEDVDLGRRVALKFLPPSLSEDGEAVRRFITEAKSASALDHPNVCTVHEIGRTEDGKHFIAMALYEGETLAERLERGPMPVDEAVEIARQVADGLGSAHAMGIVHRDIKPANIFLTAMHRPVILDFGVAKLSDRSALTQAGSTMGTFAYMSPEQARGEAVDARSDIWSLGAVLYEMVTGQRPFAGGYEQAVVYAILNEEPVGLGDLPGDLRNVLARMLAKDPAERLQSAAEVGSVLVQGLRPASSVTAMHRPSRTRRLVVPLGVTALLMVLALLSYRFWPGPSGPVTLAVMPLTGVGLEDRDWLTEGMTEGLITELAGVPALRVIQRQSVMRAAADGAGVPERLGVEYAVEGSLTDADGSLVASIRILDISSGEYVWGEEFRGAIDRLSDLQSSVTQAVVAALGVAVTGSEEARFSTRRPVDPDALEAYLRGTYLVNRFTPENFARGMALLERSIELDPGHALPYAGLAGGYALMGHLMAPPQEVFPKAKDAAFRALELDPDLAEAHLALAEVRVYYDWDWNGAEESFVRALELNPSLAAAHLHYGFFLFLFGRRDEAYRHTELARTLDPLTPMNSVWYAWLLLGDDLDRAQEELDRALELDPNVPFGLHVQGLIHSLTGDHDRAVAVTGRLVAIDSSLRWSNGIALAMAGRDLEARRVAADVAENPVNKNLWGLAGIYAALGDTDQALYWIEKAHDYRLDWLPWIGVNPVLRPLYGESRFIAVMDKMRLVR